MPLGRRRAQRLGQNGEAGELDGNFAGLGGEQRAVHADEIAEVEMLENVELLVAEDIFLRVNLDAPALVAHVNEHGLAHVAMRGDAAGERDFAAFGVMFARVLRRFPSGVNLFLNGSMPLARSAASLALRCSINEFVSSIKTGGRQVKHESGPESKKQNGLALPCGIYRCSNTAFRIHVSPRQTTPGLAKRKG